MNVEWSVCGGVPFWQHVTQVCIAVGVPEKSMTPADRILILRFRSATSETAIACAITLRHKFAVHMKATVNIVL